MTRTRTRRRSELEKALELRERFGTVMPDDAALRRLFQDYLELIRKTDRMMVDSGVAAACARCASGPGGSCCFEGMDESYGALTLYLNLLMGADLSAANEVFPGSCRYVGEKGCRLTARHSFCLNFFCPALRDFLGEAKLSELQRLIGDQLLAGWELERALAKWKADADLRRG